MSVLIYKKTDNTIEYSINIYSTLAVLPHLCLFSLKPRVYTVYRQVFILPHYILAYVKFIQI